MPHNITLKPVIKASRIHWIPDRESQASEAQSQRVARWQTWAILAAAIFAGVSALVATGALYFQARSLADTQAAAQRAEAARVSWLLDSQHFLVVNLLVTPLLSVIIELHKADGSTRFVSIGFFIGPCTQVRVSRVGELTLPANTNPYAFYHALYFLNASQAWRSEAGGMGLAAIDEIPWPQALIDLHDQVVEPTRGCQ